jgi:hypothetical protein
VRSLIIGDQFVLEVILLLSSALAATPNVHSGSVRDDHLLHHDLRGPSLFTCTLFEIVCAHFEIVCAHFEIVQLDNQLRKLNLCNAC